MKANRRLIVVLSLLAIVLLAVFVGCNSDQAVAPQTSASTVVPKPEPSVGDGAANSTVDSAEALYRDTISNIPVEMFVEDNRTAAEPAAQYYVSEWQGFSQGQRNQLIFQKALSENGAVTGFNCKTWGQHIVSAASGCVTLPSTSLPWQCPRADGYSFCSGNVRQRLQNQSANYSMFQRGNVIQMWYGGTYKPHTAIVYWADAGGITFIDCNFVGTGKVGIHWMSWSTFYSKVPAYTLYEVI